MVHRWVRAKDGALFGVCKGVARAMNLPVGMVRLVWLICVFLGGVGLGVYLLLALTLPREDKMQAALRPRLLGVCAQFSKRVDLEVGLVRFLFVSLLLASLGLGSVLYVIGYLYFSDEPSTGVG